MRAIGSDPSGPSEYPLRQYRRRRATGSGVRDQVIRCRLTDLDYARIQNRAERAQLTVAGWLVLLAQDAAMNRPSLTPRQLLELDTAVDRLRRTGKTLNAITAAENSGHPARDRALGAALRRVNLAAHAAEDVLAAVEEVFAGSASTSGLFDHPTLNGRRAPADGARRERVVIARVSATERRLLTTAAANQGLALGAWLGLLAEAPLTERPALLIEQYRRVEGLRRAVRQIGNNLRQIAAARTRRRTPIPEALLTTTARIDDLTRISLYVRGVVACAGEMAA